VKRAVSAAAFAADPIGRYWLGNTAIVWCADATTCGTLGWGQTTDADAAELIQALELAFHPALVQFDVFMDNREVAHVDWNAYARVFAYVRERLPDWRTKIRKQAVVMPDNPAGAALSGMGPMLGITYPLQFAATVDDALAWMGWTPGSVGAAAVAEIAAVAAEARAVPATVRRMRTWLEGALEGATIDAAAEALATAPRSLQRELAEAGTSFSDELVAARVRVAAQLLIATDDKVEAIARAVGYATASRLAEAFRKLLGETPAEYRAKRR
jgi:AraC-like DNA-binding protein